MYHKADKAAIDTWYIYASMSCIFFSGQFALSPNCATFAAGDALRNLVRGASVTLAAGVHEHMPSIKQGWSCRKTFEAKQIPSSPQHLVKSIMN